MNRFIKKPDDLVTSPEETRAGFIAFALEKNRKAAPYIEDAKSLKVLVSRAKTPRELLQMKEIESSLLTAAGLSDKALKYFQDDDKILAIEELVTNFLEPAGSGFVDEVIYRYLLIKGDSLGGSMRNNIGALGQQKLVRTFLSVLRIHNRPYHVVLDSKKKEWVSGHDDVNNKEHLVKAIAWESGTEQRVLSFNEKNPLVGKNIDMCLSSIERHEYSRLDSKDLSTNTLLMGELKSGIDPAGADEHWKTADTALRRIREAYKSSPNSVKTVFVGAAIERSMAQEIFKQLESHELSFAANLLNENQLIDLCDWVVRL